MEPWSRMVDASAVINITSKIPGFLKLPNS